ncbi:MAG TPA: metallophosphoesterase family protein [Anaerovoracaceae bacterium]|nr:metallophosphoesterase family protein [Anaerovoracaceae bacterium]
MNIGLISDTHGWIHPSIFEYFASCDEVWHAGDIGNIETADSLAAFRPLKAVYGNIDDAMVRKVYREHFIFKVENISVWLTHIGGSPGQYDKRVKPGIYENPPDLFICGHSHIAKVMYDKKAGFLYINPGAAGFTGFHKYMTAVRFKIDGKRIHDLEMIELGERGRIISGGL